MGEGKWNVDSVILVNYEERFEEKGKEISRTELECGFCGDLIFSVNLEGNQFHWFFCVVL